MTRLVVDAEALADVLYAAQSEDPAAIREALRRFMLAPTFPAPEPRPWIGVDEAAQRFGVSPKTVRRAVNRGDWHSTRVGRRLLVAASGPECPRVDSEGADDRDGTDDGGNGKGVT